MAAKLTIADPNLGLNAGSAITGALPMPILMVGGHGEVLFVNPAAEQFFDMGASLLLRQKLANLVPFGSPLLQLVQQARERGASIAERNVDLSSPKLGERLADVTLTPTEPGGAVVVLLQERSLAQRIDRQLTYRGAARSMSGMAAVLAHEIKNPLAGIRGAAQLLEDSVAPADKSLARLICNESDRIHALIDRMEAFGDPMALAQTPVNIHEVLDRVRQVAATSFARRHRIVEIFDPSLPPVLGDRDHLIQAFMNVVRNAADAAPPDGGEIVLTTAYRPGVRVSTPMGGQGQRLSLPLEVTVRDNGPGISSDLLPHIFDPFVTTKTNGAGLGLALVAKIIGDHGGVIECESQPRRTVFRVLLPVAANAEAPKYESTRMPDGTILIADDDAAIRTVLNQALGRAGYDVRTTANAAGLWRWVAQGEGNLVITDVILPDENAFDLLPRIKRLRPDLPVVVMSAQNNILTAITAAERGAYEYLPKPFDLKDLTSIVRRALSKTQQKSAMAALDSGDERLPLIGRSPAMQEIYRIIARLTQADLTVMISGESGTGKELVARALHDYGKRRNGSFIAVNMAAIPKELIESELFGHERGAFTGATGRGVGRFEQAEGGTLFLDEIGDMPLEAQTRLLRVLQQGEYTTVGGRTPIKTDVRIIAATNRDLRQLIQQGLFREDLFYRLNVVPMRLPPLRERTEDIPDLVRHFLRKAEGEGLPTKRLETAAVERLKTHSWPGNVRELENLIRRLVVLNPDELIAEAAVVGELTQLGRAPLPTDETDVSLSQMVERYLTQHFAEYGDRLPPVGLYDRIIQEVERPLIAISLAAARGNQIRAAQLLGVNRNTLRKKIRELGVEVIRGLRSS